MFFLITFLHNSSYCFAGPEVLSKFEARETRSAENFCQNQILVITVQFRTNAEKYSPVIYLSETIHLRWELWRKPVRALLCWARSGGPSLTKPISQIESCRRKNFAKYHSSRNLIATTREKERFLAKNMVLLSLWFPCIWNNLFIFAVGRIPPWRGWQDNFTNCFTSFLSRSPLLHWEESTMPQTSKDKVKKNIKTKDKNKDKTKAQNTKFLQEGVHFFLQQGEKKLNEIFFLWNIISSFPCVVQFSQLKARVNAPKTLYIPWYFLALSCNRQYHQWGQEMCLLNHSFLI